MVEYTVTIKVTDEELNNAVFGGVADLVYIINKVEEEAKKQGYKEES